MHAETDHHIVGFQDSMFLLDDKGVPIVKAERVNGEWTVSSSKSRHKDVQVPAAPEGEPPRRIVIQAMVDHAHKVLGPKKDPNYPDLNGYSCTYPPVLETMP